MLANRIGKRKVLMYEKVLKRIQRDQERRYMLKVEGCNVDLKKRRKEQYFRDDSGWKW